MGAFFEQKPDPNAIQDNKKFTKATIFEDGTTTKVVPGEGTYTVAPDGTCNICT